MSVRELDVLLALCKAAPVLQTLENANKLLRQLSPYMVESFNQRFAPSPFMRDAEPSPWECLTENVTTALLSIGINFPQFRSEVMNTIMSYIRRVLAYTEAAVDVTNIAALAASLVGFLESCCKVANFWTPIERAGMVENLREILTDSFLASVDAAVASMRKFQRKGPGMGQWKHYIRHYESTGRPLGALLLQHGLMKFLVASTSLLVSNSAAFYDGDVLDVLMDGHGVISSITQDDFATVESLSDVAAAGIAMVDEGTYNSGAEGLQQLAYAVKAHALSAYCNCVVLSSSADPGALLKWLQATITDPVQMSHFILAKAAVKTLAILSKDDPNYGSGFISMLHRLIVEGTPSPRVTKVAAKCLSYILHRSSQDAIITTLNTMGHVLSSVNPEKALKAETLQPFEQQSMGSTLSLVLNSEEFRYNAYCNAIETIVGVASNSKDQKMVSLAGNILMQRIGKVTSVVSARILAGLAALVPLSPQEECKAIFDAFSKVSTDAVCQDDHALLEAVSLRAPEADLVLPDRFTDFGGTMHAGGIYHQGISTL
jgi:phosphatidylinositol 4-kinase